MPRIGIFGGSFNPPTNAHLQCAVAASEQLQLDQVVFVPAGVHWSKDQGDDPGVDVRLQLLETALTGYPNSRSIRSSCSQRQYQP